MSPVSGTVPAPTAGELDETLSSEARLSDGSPSLGDVSSWACHWLPLRGETSPADFQGRLSPHGLCRLAMFVAAFKSA
ncbi:hypothetical protein HFX_0584 [Haloferax mediterranei ATCC 33500]|uniref:Uncharacterized protein n=1 Tax=Haloferax mediterranei (strain ATCC 33500 / DSM 1411 / JCM 8866 / NBRC 14739 / NCIMB 2177 / R-4) TaxID=523841 RepID=I3R249_HALMT|nr:hypothetical protein HFX_0584 [Haloferax mediterranei ATCC 33500]